MTYHVEAKYADGRWHPFTPYHFDTPQERDEFLKRLEQENPGREFRKAD